jgi:purine-binding chemotaxis protein CheW
MKDSKILTEKQLVVFTLNREVYGIDIGAVKEIIQMQPITRIPGTPCAVEGVINLRGSVIPVIDLGKKFGLPVCGAGHNTRIMIINRPGQNVGIIVDSVSEVLRAPVEAIDPPSAFIIGNMSDYIQGIVKLPDKLVILLEIDSVLKTENKKTQPTTIVNNEVIAYSGSPTKTLKETVASKTF